MKEFLKSLPYKQFKLMAIVVCLVGDLSYIYYLYDKFSDRAIFDQAFKIAMQFYQNSGVQLPPNFGDEMFKLMHQSLILMLVLVLVMHLIIYMVYWSDKASARFYLLTLTWVAGPGTLLLGLALKVGVAKFYFLALGAVYLVTAFGLLQHPIPEKKKG